jgi:hypothetical protein
VTRKEGKMVASVQKPGGATEERVVKTGLTDGEKWEIVSGLSEGETVAFKRDEQQSRWREGGTGPRPGSTMFGGPGRR